MKLSSIEAIVRALNDGDVPFIVVGGLAVAAHGYGRQTRDLDLVIRLDSDAVHAAFAALASLGYRPLVPVTAEGFADPDHEEPFSFQDEYERATVHEIARVIATRPGPSSASSPA